MARLERGFSKSFEQYQEIIAHHANYSGLPNKFNSKGEITWVRVNDAARARWWDAQKVLMGLPDRASVARRIHPEELGGFKPCQICGREMSIFPNYPNVRALKKLNGSFGADRFRHFVEDTTEIVETAYDEVGSSGLEAIANIFEIKYVQDTPDDLAERIITLGRFLSPGAMSNAPDRLDGFHTYNGCCRAEHDTGRHMSNLSRYSTDRRAYENWADGDWRGADRLMGEYKRQQIQVACPSCNRVSKMTADHIGPISLGFTHRMWFQPLCIGCNSQKNNRLTQADIRKLIATEASGETVISWHSKAIWDTLKVLSTTDESATRVSALMRTNLHHVLVLLSIINEAGHREFLETFLHPEFAKFDYDFLNFNVTDGTFEAIRRTVDSVNTRKHAVRYLRVAFETLEIYAEKDNRKNNKWVNGNVDALVGEILEALEADQPDSARNKLLLALEILAENAGKYFRVTA